MAKILVVEDYASLLKIYQMTLSIGGHKVELAQNGQEAYDKATASDYDLIILDMLLPKMSGLDFLREFKPKKRTPKVKVMCISNVPNPDMVSQALALGARNFLAKPLLTPKELSEEVDEILDKKK